MKPRVMRWFAMVAVVVAASFGLSTATSPAASASAQGCTQSQLGGSRVLLCTNVIGKGLKVDHVTVSIDLKGYTCNAYFKYWGVLSNGRSISGTAAAKCSTGRAWVKFWPRATFKNNSKVCGALIENRQVRREHACVKLHK